LQTLKSHVDLGRELALSVKGDVHFDGQSRAMYNSDASIYSMDPVGVVAPKDAEDVSIVLRLAAQYGIPILPRGGGTSLAGQGTNHAVILDFTKYMNRLVELNAAETWAQVEPGIVLDQLSYLAGPEGLRFGPDPASSNRGTVGGAIGNNSCGSHSIVYGKTLDHVLELEVLLSDGTLTTLRALTPQGLEEKLSLPGLEGEVYRGALRIAQEQQEEIERRYPKILRRVSGYNLDQILSGPVNLARLAVGSEGTLLTVTKAKVSLVPRPKATALAVLHFHSLFEAMEATVELLKEPVTAIELMDKAIVQGGRAHRTISRRMGFVEGDPEALLIAEVAGETSQEASAKLQDMTERIRRHGLGYHTAAFDDPVDQANVWAVRRDGLGLIMRLEGDAKPLPFVEDTAVDPERLPEYVRRFDDLVRQHGTTAAYYGHASVGCLHIRPIVDLKTLAGVEQLEQIAQGVADLVLEFGGSLSGEHGDGIVRGAFAEKMFGRKLVDGFRELKRTFDPQGIMNPGKIFDTPALTSNLRTGPNFSAEPLETTLDFSKVGGFVGMVEMCNNQGVCRKVIGGTMCPSYMVTRDEMHSTRGRANALRAVLTGTLPASEFTGKNLYNALDLCLECKACKAECPSSVDMAKLKYEFLDHYHRAHGTPLRDRLFADIARLSRLGSLLAPLSNWVAVAPPTRWLLSVLGIHPNRKLPVFSGWKFSSWHKKHRPLPNSRDRGQVILFHDTFMENNHPSVGSAATRLLEAAGFEVLLVPRNCCGRPMISKGMLARAREEARINVDLLHPYAAKGIPIVGTEPSCLLTLRDEYPDLLPGDPKTLTVAKNTYLLEEFLVHLEDNGGAGIKFAPRPGKVIFHGHCHQKALIGTDASIRALRLVPEVEVEDLDAGCCGMAGAFGFEKEHFDLSMQVGERVLFPALRNSDERSTVVVTGVSCRQQIEQGTKVIPTHLAEFLDAARVDFPNQ
jgi:FAD/FMN-containing dehydrogenase/Fe-S oxidoreductase